MSKHNGRGVKIRHSKTQENTRHVLGIRETSLTRPPVFTNNPLVLSFNLLLSIYYVPGTILGTGDIAVSKTNNPSALTELTF